MPGHRIAVRLAADGMAAYVSVAPGAEQGLREALARAGVVTGVDEELLGALEARLAQPEFEQAEVRIAAGTRPAPGGAAWLEPSFEYGIAPGSVSDDGHMNFFERRLLKTVNAGQLVATLHAAEPGSPGVTVEGRELPAPAVAALKLALGAGVAQGEGGELRARQPGVLLYKPGQLLDVVSEHVHQGTVDLHTGNLEMQGSLVVKGDVERLLQARASGDLEVLGSVSGGSLCAGGSLRVRGTVRGGDDARVIAEHDVTIKSCEAAVVTAGGTLRVQDAVNSQLAGVHVVVVGRLRGGGATAERSLIVKEAGAAGGVPTSLRAGEPLELPDLEGVQRAVLMQKLRRMAERGGVREAFGSRGSARGKGGKLGRAAAASSAEELQELTARARKRTELLRAARIELGFAHPGVELSIGGARLELEQPVRGVRYALSPETGQLVAERSLR